MFSGDIVNLRCQKFTIVETSKCCRRLFQAFCQRNTQSHVHHFHEDAWNGYNFCLSPHWKEWRGGVMQHQKFQMGQWVTKFLVGHMTLKIWFRGGGEGRVTQRKKKDNWDTNVDLDSSRNVSASSFDMAANGSVKIPCRSPYCFCQVERGTKSTMAY